MAALNDRPSAMHRRYLALAVRTLGCLLLAGAAILPGGCAEKKIELPPIPRDISPSHWSRSWGQIGAVDGVAIRANVGIDDGVMPGVQCLIYRDLQLVGMGQVIRCNAISSIIEWTHQNRDLVPQPGDRLMFEADVAPTPTRPAR